MALPAATVLLPFIPQEDWLEAVAPHIQARIARYSANEIRFNLMAVVADRQEQINKQLAAVRARRQAAAAKLGLSDGGDAAAAAGGMETDEPGSSSSSGLVPPLPDDEAALQHVLAEAEGEIGRWVYMGMCGQGEWVDGGGGWGPGVWHT